MVVRRRGVKLVRNGLMPADLGEEFSTGNWMIGCLFVMVAGQICDGGFKRE